MAAVRRTGANLRFRTERRRDERSHSRAAAAATATMCHPTDIILFAIPRSVSVHPGDQALTLSPVHAYALLSYCSILSRYYGQERLRELGDRDGQSER